MSEKQDEIKVGTHAGANPRNGGDADPASRATRGMTRAATNMHPSGLRRVTERRVAHLLLRYGCLSRVELAREAGLSVATIGKIIDTLVASGVVEKIVSDTARTGPTLGRPAEYFSLSRSRRRHLVVELGVRRTQLAALPIAGPIGDIPTAHFRTPAELGVLERRLKTAVGMLDVSEPLAVLVSVPGVVDERKKRVLYSPNLHWTEGSVLFDVISRAITGRLVAVQEIRALALGYLVGSTPDDSYLLVDVGDGVGGALVVQGRLHEGPLPLSGELGHTPIRGNRRLCGCGGVGCLETLLGRRGLVRTAKRHIGREVRSWAQLTHGLSDKPVPAWLHRTLDEAAQIIAGALNVAGVAKVVLVGDLLDAEAALTRSREAFQSGLRAMGDEWQSALP